jgi:hypothetical protein
MAAPGSTRTSSRRSGTAAGSVRPRLARQALSDLDKMEEQGFALPPGTYLDARLRINTESDANERGLSREIMIKQAELAYAAGKDMMALAIQLEGKQLDIANAGRAAAVREHQVRHRGWHLDLQRQGAGLRAYLDAYKTKVQIYTAQVQAQIALVDVYKARSRPSAKAQINHELVEQYKAQIEAALSAVEIYKARIEGIRIKADIEKTKIEMYGEQVPAYSAKVNAYTAGVEGYRASLEAEKTKQPVYQSQVDAFTRPRRCSRQGDRRRIAAFRGRLDANTSCGKATRQQIAGEPRRRRRSAPTTRASRPSTKPRSPR